MKLIEAVETQIREIIPFAYTHQIKLNGIANQVLEIRHTRLL